MEDNRIRLSLCIWGFEDILHEDISKGIGFQPTKIHEKGKRLNPRYPKVAKENGWFLDYPGESSFKIQMDYFLDIIEKRRDFFSTITNKYLCEFSCLVQIDNINESTPWIHLGSKFFDVLKGLKIEFDIDIYV